MSSVTGAPSASQPGPTKQMCKTLKRVIIENFGFCNRTCIFCVNSKLERQKRTDYLPVDWYTAVLSELSAGGYRGSLMFGRYHEPLSDEVTIARVALARDHLPENHLLLNSNGDYVTADLVSELDRAGADELRLMLYLPNKDQFSTHAALRKAKGLLERLGVEGSVQSHDVDVNLTLFAHTDTKQLRVTLHAENYLVTGYGADRGGAISSLSAIRRSNACFAPRFELNIDYTGDVMPCCNMVSDFPAHAPFVLGNIGSDTLTEIYFGKTAAKFRQAVEQEMPSPTPCRSCQYYWPERLAAGERIHIRDIR